MEQHFRKPFLTHEIIGLNTDKRRFPEGFLSAVQNIHFRAMGVQFDGEGACQVVFLALLINGSGGNLEQVIPSIGVFEGGSAIGVSLRGEVDDARGVRDRFHGVANIVIAFGKRFEIWSPRLFGLEQMKSGLRPMFRGRL